MDFFRRIDKDQDGKITRQEFIDGILASSKQPNIKKCCTGCETLSEFCLTPTFSLHIKSVLYLFTEFPTTKLEMTAVADIFDRDGDGYIDYYEFVAALHPNKDAYRPTTDADKIEDEVNQKLFYHDIIRFLQCICQYLGLYIHSSQVTRQVAQCKCAKRFQVEQIGENKYRVSIVLFMQMIFLQPLRKILCAKSYLLKSSEILPRLRKLMQHQHLELLNCTALFQYKNRCKQSIVEWPITFLFFMFEHLSFHSSEATIPLFM